jgi:hypothetical protein
MRMKLRVDGKWSKDEAAARNGSIIEAAAPALNMAATAKRFAEWSEPRFTFNVRTGNLLPSELTTGSLSFAIPDLPSR